MKYWQGYGKLTPKAKDEAMEKMIGEGDSYAIVSSKGGMVVDFVWQGDQIIYPERKTGNKSRGGIPICFPFFGPAPEKFSEIPQHGWLRHQELVVKASGGSDFLVKFSGKNEPTAAYPWQLEYEISVQIHMNQGLYVTFKVRRLQDGQKYHAPINPAFHPYFSNLGKHVVRIGSKEIGEFHQEDEIVLRSKPILIDNGKRLIAITLAGDFNDDSYLTLWSDNPGEYFCVEPVLTHPASFATPMKRKFLAEREVSEISLYIEFIR